MKRLAITLFVILLSTAFATGVDAAPKKKHDSTRYGIIKEIGVFCTTTTQAQEAADLMSGTMLLRDIVETMNLKWGRLQCDAYDGSVWLLREIAVRSTYTWRLGIYPVRLPWHPWAEKFLVVRRFEPKA